MAVRRPNRSHTCASLLLLLPLIPSFSRALYTGRMCRRRASPDKMKFILPPCSTAPFFPTKIYLVPYMIRASLFQLSFFFQRAGMKEISLVHASISIGWKIVTTYDLSMALTNPEASLASLSSSRLVFQYRFFHEREGIPAESMIDGIDRTSR